MLTNFFLYINIKNEKISLKQAKQMKTITQRYLATKLEKLQEYPKSNLEHKCVSSRADTFKALEKYLNLKLLFQHAALLLFMHSTAVFCWRIYIKRWSPHGDLIESILQPLNQASVTVMYLFNCERVLGPFISGHDTI